MKHFISIQYHLSALTNCVSIAVLKLELEPHLQFKYQASKANTIVPKLPSVLDKELVDLENHFPSSLVTSSGRGIYYTQADRLLKQVCVILLSPRAGDGQVKGQADIDTDVLCLCVFLLPIVELLWHKH